MIDKVMRLRSKILFTIGLLCAIAGIVLVLVGLRSGASVALFAGGSAMLVELLCAIWLGID